MRPDPLSDVFLHRIARYVTNSYRTASLRGDFYFARYPSRPLSARARCAPNEADMLRTIATSVPRPILLLCLAMISISACPARVWATTAVAGIVADADASGDALLRFDIPSQPLQSALESYGAFADVSLLYDSSLTAGRVSTPVQGEMTARAALSRLLDGSGLVPRYTGSKTVTLVAGRTNSPDADGDAATDPAAARRYFGLIQTRVHDAFCAQPLLAQGARRVAFRLWVGTNGVIGPVALLGSSGDPATDAAVVSALQGAGVGEPAPPALAQPFTFVVQPRASGRNWGCEAATDVPKPGRSHGR